MDSKGSVRGFSNMTKSGPAWPDTVPRSSMGTPTDDHHGKVKSLSDALSVYLVGEVGDCDACGQSETRPKRGVAHQPGPASAASSVARGRTSYVSGELLPHWWLLLLLLCCCCCCCCRVGIQTAIPVTCIVSASLSKGSARACTHHCSSMDLTDRWSTRLP